MQHRSVDHGRPRHPTARTDQKETEGWNPLCVLAEEGIWYIEGQEDVIRMNRNVSRGMETSSL